MSAPELSRIVKARLLPGDPVKVAADEAERASLSARFGLPAIESLSATIELEKSGKSVKANGRLTASIQQICAVSGEEFATAIDEPITLRFVEEGTLEPALSEDGEIEIELEADDCDEIEYSGETFDLGEAIAQTLGLAIDPYAEGPNANSARKAAGIVAEGEQEGPLAAALSALKKD
jgi:uncharacterized metal-binding protein YceD (DUF177 family)